MTIEERATTMATTIPPDAPPYQWARKHLLATANGVTCRGTVG
jgi:hypothetical protein